MTTETIWLLFGLCALGILFALSVIQDLSARLNNLERRTKHSNLRDKREVSLNEERN